MPCLHSARRRGRAVVAASLVLAVLAVAAPAASAAPRPARVHGVGFGAVPPVADSGAELGPRALADTAPPVATCSDETASCRSRMSQAPR